ncbi:MAG: Rho termination factor N-terminal domain-containing protein [Solirubrobacterales bacterium]
MNKTELESKHIAELHELAAEAGVERYRMLSRAELIEKLVGGNGRPQTRSQGGGRSGQRERKPRAPRQRQRSEAKPKPEPRREPEAEAPERSERKPEPSIAPATTPPPSASRPKRKRRRRWGRRPKGVRIHDLLLPAAPGRQAIVYADTRAGCTALLREIAAELSDASNGPDPIALLIDPTPEELADWKREAPQAEIVAAGKAQHADDALAQARARAGTGEDVIVLIDSLSRFAETFAGADEARELFDAGRGGAGGSLTVVAAVERPA